MTHDIKAELKIPSEKQCLYMYNYIVYYYQIMMCDQGEIQDFFGGVHHHFNTNIPHSFFLFGRILVVLESRRSCQGEGGAHPAPPPRSAPSDSLKDIDL